MTRSAVWPTVALLVAYNVGRAVGLLGQRPVVGAALLTAALVGIIVRSRLGVDELGLRRDRLAAGARWGGAVLLLVTVVLVVAAAIPATAEFLDDPRVDVSGPELLAELVVGVLLVTVIPEELAFRGVLLGAGTSLWGVPRAVATSSALFGLWHIAPTLHTLTENRALSDTTSTIGGTVLVVAGSVVSTAVAGGLFCWLRLRSRSLVAPIVAHLAVNGVAFVVAWVAGR